MSKFDSLVQNLQPAEKMDDHKCARSEVRRTIPRRPLPNAERDLRLSVKPTSRPRIRLTAAAALFIVFSILFWLGATATLLFAQNPTTVSPAQARLSAAFNLENSPVLKGFTRSPYAPGQRAPYSEVTPKPKAALRARYFHGATKLEYSVLLFSSPDALRAWERNYNNRISLLLPRSHPYNGPSSLVVTEKPLLRHFLAADRERAKRQLASYMRERGVRPTPAVLDALTKDRLDSVACQARVNRVRISVTLNQSLVMVRRGEAGPETLLSDAEMRRVAKSLARELAGRAQKLPDNRK